MNGSTWRQMCPSLFLCVLGWSQLLKQGWHPLSACASTAHLFLLVSLRSIRVAQIVASWHPGCEKMEREWGNGERFALYSKIVSFCRKMLNMALLSQISQKTLHTRFEKIILGQIRCEKAPKAHSVRAWTYIWVSFSRAGILAVLCHLLFFKSWASVWPNLMR